MALVSNNVTPTSTLRRYEKTSISSSPNLRASHTIMGRVKFTTAGTAINWALSWLDNSTSLGGSSVARGTTGDPATQYSGYRFNSLGSPAATQSIAAGTYTTGTWRHFAFVYNSSTTTQQLYVDGSLVDSDTSATGVGPNVTATRVVLGWIQGLTADVAVFNRALTGTEVLSMASYRQPQVTSGLLGFWRLDSDGTDSSGNGQTLVSAGSTGNTPTFSTSDNPPQPELPIVEGDATFTSSSTLLALGTAGLSAAATLTNGSTVVATGNTTKPASLTLVNSSTVVATANTAKPAALTLTNSSTVVATANTAKPSAATLVNATTLALTPTAAKPGAVTLTSGSTVAATAALSIPSAATLTTSSALALDPAVAVPGSVTLQTGSRLVTTFTAARRYTNYDNVNAASWSLNAAQPFSIAGWIYLVQNDSGGAGDVFYTEQSGVEHVWLGYQNAGTSRLVWDVNGAQHTEDVAPGAWHHMALTNDGSNVRCYLDGVQVYSTASSLSATYDHADIGDFAFGTSIVEIGQVKVWANYALSPSELATEIAFWTPQTAPANVYAWWQLTTNLPTQDSSGNGHDLSGPGAAGEHTVPGALAPTTGAAALVTSSALALTPTVLKSAAVALTTSSTIAAAANTQKPAAATLTTSSTALGAGTVSVTAASSLTTSSSVVATAATAKPSSLALVASSTLLPSGTVGLSSSVSLATSSTVLATAGVGQFGALALVTSSTVLPSAVQAQAGSVALVTNSTILASAGGGLALVTSSSFVATGAVAKPSSVSLTTSSTVVAQPTAEKLAAASLTTASTLLPTANTTKPAAVSLASSTTVLGAPALAVRGAATLVTSSTLSAQAQLQQQGALTLTTGSTISLVFPVVPVTPSGWIDGDGSIGASHSAWTDGENIMAAAHGAWCDPPPPTAAEPHSAWLAA